MGALMREHDWSTSPLGNPETWPQSLRSVVGLLLASKFPMFVAWGPKLGFLYNDAYTEILGAKHPAALGARFQDIWSEIWSDISPLIDTALAGQSSYHEDLPLVVKRKGYDEAAWFTFSYSPVRDETGQVAGMFCTVAETTGRLLAERRNASERERLARMFEQAPGFIAILKSPEHVFDFANATFRRLFGNRNFVGRTVRHVFPDLEGQGFFELLDQVYTTGERFVARHIPIRLERSPGTPPEERVLDFIYEPITDEAGQVTGIFCEGHDVTETRRAEERLQLATEAASLGIFDIDLTTMTMDWDHRQRELWHVGPEEVITDETFVSGIYPGDRDLVRNAVARAFESDGDHLYAAEYRVLPHGTGDERWVAAMGRVHFEGARPVRLIGTTQDITERKRAEAALRESEARLRELNETQEQRVAEALAERKLLADVFESTDAMMSVADPDLRLLAFNRPYAQEVERLGGRRPRVGDRIPDLYVGQPELAAPVEANWSRAVRGEVFSVTEEHGIPERYSRVYERRFEPLYDREGCLVGAYQYATDVTERLRDQHRAEEAEAAQREADALYRAYFQNSAEALFVIGVLDDGGFVIEEINPAHRKALAGLGLELAPGTRLEEQLPPAVAEVIATNYQRVIETDQLQSYRESADLGGQVTHYDTVLVPVRDDEGHIVRIVGSARDMTAQVQTEEALRQSQKMEAMGQLTGGVAHDFNNLLTPIIASLDMLLRRGVGSERERRLMDGALQSAERAKVLVQRLLAFARRQPLQPGPVDVKKLVENMAELIASTLGPRIDVRVDLADNLPPAMADANQLEMAVLNLAVNARDAMPDAGVLTIAAVRESVRGLHPAKLRAGHYVRLSVKGHRHRHGRGHACSCGRALLLHQGHRQGHGPRALDGARADRTARRRADDHQQPRQGHHCGPVAAHQRGCGGGGWHALGSATARQAQGTALLVDDEDLVRMSTADMLMDLGYEVVEARSAEEALRMVQEGLHPDLVVTDHLMPGMSGVDLAHDLRSRWVDLPVLIVSGYAEADGLAAGLPRLTKPFRSSELAASLADLVLDGVK
jgi:PAS domain S-box-containing protein